MVDGTSRFAEAPGASDRSAAQHDVLQPDGTWVEQRPRGWRHALLRRCLAGADVLAALAASVVLATLSDATTERLLWALACLPMWIVVSKALGLYDRDTRAIRHMTVDEVPLIVLWALIGTSVLAFVLGFAPSGRPTSAQALEAGVVAALLGLSLRAFARLLWRRVTPRAQVLVVGTVSAAEVLRRKLELFPDVHAEIAAVVPDGDLDGLVADPATLARVDRIAFAPSSLDEGQLDALLDLAHTTGIALTMLPPGRGPFPSGVRLEHLADVPLLDYPTGAVSRSSLFVKRALDVVVSSTALVVLGPLFLAIATAVKLDSRGPALFCQWRAGRGGEPFRLWKFRSMVVDAEEQLTQLVSFDELVAMRLKLPDDPRITRAGRFLRRWSLDELPQLWNVLKGEMSLVGPRPEQLPVVVRYSPDERVRLAVRPGVTGPMQVFGRAATTWKERLALERAYVENLSIGADLRLLAMTVAVVLGRRGAS